MKKVLSIVLATLILFSGLHASLATHICGREVAAVKLSFTGQKASCGMAQNADDCSKTNGVRSNCCHNKVALYSVDHNYNPSTFHVKVFSNHLVQAYLIPVTLTQNSKRNIQNSCPFPPGNILASSVSLTDICVFRI
jgi:hypothetical protein